MRKLICIILSSLFLLSLSGCGDNSKITRPYSQEYVVGEENIKGDVDIDKFTDIDPAFEIGANSKGYAVFKDPDEAFKVFKDKYKNELKLIRKQYHLLPISKRNYAVYGTYGWQVTTSTESEQERAMFVSCFIDIYENSFK